MKVECGKIIKCTENELFDYYLTRNFDDIFSFKDFKQKIIKAGTVVIDEED